jgi:periplasmic protein TonB
MHTGEQAMLNVLLESKAARPRRVGSTITSAVLHAGLIAAAVALTLPGPVDAKGRNTVRPPKVIWVAPAASRRPAPPEYARAPVAVVEAPDPRRLIITVPKIVPDQLPPILDGAVPPPDEIAIGRGVRTASPIGGDLPGLAGNGAAIDERNVDRAPRVLGNAPEPRYPATLRDAGVQGRVVVQFVVDTLGRAELDGLQVVESAHPQFLESVRVALARYRFTVGEAGGRKVRTRVQIPFDFTLVR